MKVLPVGHSSVSPLQAVRQTRVSQKTLDIRAARLEALPVAKVDMHGRRASTDSVDPRLPDKGSHSDARGLLRLLETGHFKGVADVRLRVNFFDELSARAAANIPVVAGEEAENLAGAVRTAVDELADSLAVDDEMQELLAELVTDFETAVLAATEGLTADAVLDPDALREAIQGAFDTLVERLATLLDDGAGEPAQPGPRLVGVVDTSSEGRMPGRKAISTTPAGDLSARLDEAFASLTAAFDGALSRLMSAISTASQLPDPSPPTGKGVAYDKFLAIYNELRGATTAT